MTARTTFPARSSDAPDLAALKTHAAAACQRFFSARPHEDAAAGAGDTVRAALTAFAAEGLLDLAFLNPAASEVHARDLRQAAAVIEALASQSGGLASIYMVNAIVSGAALALAATPAQKADLLPRLRRGDLRLAFALTEPEAGSDAASLATNAAPVDGGGFRLTGEKMYTTGAASADVILVAARVAGADKRAVSVFLVPAGARGLRVEPLDMLAGDLHASCRLRLESVPLGSDAILGGPEGLGKAWATLRLTGAYERLVVAALALGLAAAIVERSVAFARQRHQFGQAIANFQVIQHALVEMKTIETGMRLFVEHALATLESGGDPTQAVCMAKYVCAEQLQQVAALGMRVLGGRAYFAFEDMSRYYREAPFSLYAGGTIEIQKLLIARTMGLA